MALDPDTMAEIRAYMDERGENWRLHSANEARQAAYKEIEERESSKNKRLQFITTIGGVSLAAVIAFAYNNLRETAKSGVFLQPQNL